MLPSIWQNEQIGDPIYQGLMLGGLHVGTPLLKADYPGLRAIRLSDGSVVLADALPDSYAVPAGGGVSPVGSVTMWAGASTSLPSGWLLCDGTPFLATAYPELAALLGTTFGTPAPGDCLVPDMRDRFVVGAGTTYSRNSKGGSVNVGAHAHGLNSHTHNVNIAAFDSGGQNAGHNHDFAHTHNVIGNTGPDTAAAHSHVEDDTFSGRPTTSTGSITRGTTAAVPDSTSGPVSAGHEHSIDPPTTESTAPLSPNTATANNPSAGGANENRPPYIGIFFIICASGGGGSGVELWY